MSKYTADEVRHVSGVCAFNLTLASPFPYRFIEMLQEFEATLRQQEQEAKRDPVTDPRPGDMVIFQECERPMLFTWGADLCPPVSWAMMASQPGATVIPRREVGA